MELCAQVWIGQLVDYSKRQPNFLLFLFNLSGLTGSAVSIIFLKMLSLLQFVAALNPSLFVWTLLFSRFTEGAEFMHLKSVIEEE